MHVETECKIKELGSAKRILGPDIIRDRKKKSIIHISKEFHFKGVK